MFIETVQENENSTRVVVDDTLDLVIVKENNGYIVKVLENNCVDIKVEKVTL